MAPGVAIYIVGGVVTVATVIAFKEFVYEPYIAPQLVRWADAYALRREEMRARRAARVQQQYFDDVPAPAEEPRAPTYAVHVRKRSTPSGVVHSDPGMEMADVGGSTATGVRRRTVWTDAQPEQIAPMQPAQSPRAAITRPPVSGFTGPMTPPPTTAPALIDLGPFADPVAQLSPAGPMPAPHLPRTHTASSRVPSPTQSEPEDIIAFPMPAVAPVSRALSPQTFEPPAGAILQRGLGADRAISPFSEVSRAASPFSEVRGGAASPFSDVRGAASPLPSASPFTDIRAPLPAPSPRTGALSPFSDVDVRAGAASPFSDVPRGSGAASPFSDVHRAGATSPFSDARWSDVHADASDVGGAGTDADAESFQFDFSDDERDGEEAGEARR